MIFFMHYTHTHIYLFTSCYTFTANSDPAPGCIDQKLSNTTVSVQEEYDCTLAIDNLMSAQKKILFDFINFMKSHEYKNQLKMEIAKEKVCSFYLITRCYNFKYEIFIPY